MDMARKAGVADKRAWLEMAERWLGMIPDRQRTAEDRFDLAVGERGTGQDPSASQH